MCYVTPCGQKILTDEDAEQSGGLIGEVCQTCLTYAAAESKIFCPLGESDGR